MYNRYRAKDNKGKWYYGSLYHGTNRDMIINKNSEVIVDGKTICICINHNDSDKKEIYTGDIIEFGNHNEGRFLAWFSNEMQCLEAVRLVGEKGVYFNGYDYHNNSDYRISWEDFCFMLSDPYGDFEGKIKVIGNIFDNPELVEAENLSHISSDSALTFEF